MPVPASGMAGAAVPAGVRITYPANDGFLISGEHCGPRFSEYDPARDRAMPRQAAEAHAAVTGPTPEAEVPRRANCPETTVCNPAAVPQSRTPPIR
jgi:hypothetical protein